MDKNYFIKAGKRYGAEKFFESKKFEQMKDYILNNVEKTKYNTSNIVQGLSDTNWLRDTKEQCYNNEEMYELFLTWFYTLYTHIEEELNIDILRDRYKDIDGLEPPSKYKSTYEVLKRLGADSIYSEEFKSLMDDIYKEYSSDRCNAFMNTEITTVIEQKDSYLSSMRLCTGREAIEEFIDFIIENHQIIFNEDIRNRDAILDILYKLPESYVFSSNTYHHIVSIIKETSSNQLLDLFQYNVERYSGDEIDVNEYLEEVVDIYLECVEEYEKPTLQKIQEKETIESKINKFKEKTDTAIKSMKINTTDLQIAVNKRSTIYEIVKVKEFYKLVNFIENEVNNNNATKINNPLIHKFKSDSNQMLKLLTDLKLKYNSTNDIKVYNIKSEDLYEYCMLLMDIYSVLL